VKLVTGVIATLAALVLGLLIASAKNSFERVNEGYRDSMAAMFASFGLLAPRNAVTITVLFEGALSLSASISLLEALNSSLGGYITISRGPADATLSQLGQ
jgi:hypothetical protein